jgi:hypothetical protein
MDLLLWRKCTGVSHLRRYQKRIDLQEMGAD